MEESPDRLSARKHSLFDRPVWRGSSQSHLRPSRWQASARIQASVDPLRLTLAHGDLCQSRDQCNRPWQSFSSIVGLSNFVFFSYRSLGE